MWTAAQNYSVLSNNVSFQLTMQHSSGLAQNLTTNNISRVNKNG